MAKKRKKNWCPLKAEKTARRKAHFAKGGTVAMWRGRAATLDQSTNPRRRNKNACRGDAARRAIQGNY